MRLKGSTPASGKSILVIDDNEEYLRSTLRIVEREGHEAVGAATGPEALELLRKRSVDLVLVDYFMPAMTGEQFVQELRKFDPYVQVILQTGYASERPPREMLKRLDIQGYHDKSDGPDKLRLWIDVGLRAAFTVQLLNKSRAGLAYILAVTPQLHKIQPLEELLQGVLVQTVGLLGATDSLLAVASAPVREEGPDGFVAMAQPGGSLRVRAATGRFAGCEALAGAFTAQELEHLSHTLGGVARVQPVDGGTVVPLRIGDAALGLIYVQGAVVDERDQELLIVFANQAAVAIQNASLYELAAVDQLTRVYTRRFFDEALLRELRTAHRSGEPLSLLLVDVDDMKGLNDGGGHLCGDQALAAVGAVLRRATRATDIVGRYGGDEFAVILPSCDPAGAEVVARRIVALMQQLTVTARDGSERPVRLTVGGVSLHGAGGTPRPRSQAYFDGTAKGLIATADHGLYDGKREGKARAAGITSQTWPCASVAPPAARESERLAG